MNAPWPELPWPVTDVSSASALYACANWCEGGRRKEKVSLSNRSSSWSAIAVDFMMICVRQGQDQTVGRAPGRLEWHRVTIVSCPSTLTLPPDRRYIEQAFLSEISLCCRKIPPSLPYFASRTASITISPLPDAGVVRIEFLLLTSRLAGEPGEQARWCIGASPTAGRSGLARLNEIQRASQCDSLKLNGRSK